MVERSELRKFYHQEIILLVSEKNKEIPFKNYLKIKLIKTFLQHL